MRENDRPAERSLRGSSPSLYIDVLVILYHIAHLYFVEQEFGVLGTPAFVLSVFTWL